MRLKTCLGCGGSMATALSEISSHYCPQCASAFVDTCHGYSPECVAACIKAVEARDEWVEFKKNYDPLNKATAEDVYEEQDMRLKFVRLMDAAISLLPKRKTHGTA